MTDINSKNTFIILDWDDTLFPTSWIIKRGIHIEKLLDTQIYDDISKYFEHLDNTLCRFFKKITNYGIVIIVTNAQLIWIDMCRKILPKTNKLLDKIQIISAKDKYGHTHMISWKKLAFNDIVKEKKTIHVISIGDAEYEYEALINLSKLKNIDNKLLKTVKLTRDPDGDTVIDQIEVIEKCFDKIYFWKKHLDLNISSK